MVDISSSFLGQSNTQIARLKRLNADMADLQRQVSTQKKYEDFKGFGAAAQNIQDYRMTKEHLQVYMTNIDATIPRVNLMTDSMTQATDLTHQLTGMLQVEMRKGTIAINTLNTLADQNLNFVHDLANTKLDGRYLFAGSDTQSEPMIDQDLLKNNMETQVDDWLNGVITTDQLIAAVDAMTPTELGMNPALTAAGTVNVRINQSTEVDYTSKADSNGLQDVVRVMALAAKLKLPGATDTPTLDEFHQVIDYIMSKGKTAVDTIQQEQVTLASKFTIISDVKDKHQQDMGLMDQLLIKNENVDLNEAVTKLQSLQTQLSSSYEVTRILSQLTLANFLS